MKKTQKEIEGTLRNKLCKQYTAKMENYQERIDRLAKELSVERKKRIEAQSKVEELEEKVAQYEDWNRRLQEFMDMNEEDRKNYLMQLKVSAEISDVFDMYKHFLGFLA